VLASAAGAAGAAVAAAGGGISIIGSSLSTSTSTSGPAGDINITTPGALVLSGTTIASQSTSTAADAGPVGMINLSGGSVSLLGGSLVSAISAGGTAVAPEGGTPAAAITISSTDGSSPFVIADSTVTTQAAVTNGSNIVVNAGESPLLLTNSVITASAAAGNGGNITINNAGNTALQRSAIVAQAGPGNGGAINIGLKKGAIFIQDSESLVSATSKTGNNGTVTINSPQTDLNSALRVPEVSAARAPELTANACRHEGSHSTFVREGRGGVAPDPQDYLRGPTHSATPTAWNIEDAPRPDAPAAAAPLLLAKAATTLECP
jgi:large exoprotein involved in heme utilization and adhesion